MTHQTNLQAAEAPISWTIGQVRDKAKHLGARIIEVFAISANAWAAADKYEELSKLSVAELKRRGIPDGDLHRWVFETLGKPKSQC